MSNFVENNKQWLIDVEKNKTKNDILARLGVEKQQPKALWIGCVDSRVQPELITKSGIGELFVHRNIANQVKLDDANSMSVLEYAVKKLKVPYIVVCGHTGCGGIEHCFDSDLDLNLKKWLNGICGSTKPDDFDTTQESLVEHNVINQVNKIKKIPFVIEAKTQVHGFVFDLKTGSLKDIIITDKKL
jgi:carbonic anhydrase